jgi:maltooligosyltrehalose trehalohydrolase
MLFMGQEFGASSPFQYFTDHNPELGKLVTEGRRREFKDFSHFGDPSTRESIPDPQAESTFARSKLPLDELARPPGSTLCQWYADLLQLRRTDPVLRDQSRERMQPRVISDDVLAVRRWSGTEQRLLLVNFGPTPVEVDLSDDGWYVLLDSSSGSRVDAATAEVLPTSAAILARTELA